MAKRITGLQVQKRNNNRLNIYLDGEYAFGLSRYVAAWLQVGQDLTEEKITALMADDAVEAAYQKSTKFIGYRMRTTSEVDKHLTKKGIEPQVIGQVIERLNENGLLNDEGFAKMWIENRSEFRPRSQRLLALELRRKGINSETIQNVIERTPPEDELAYLAAKKRIRRYEHLDWQDFQRKLGSHLARRGFSYSTIKPVVYKVWTEKNQDI
ncbi:MAG: RecX family transcriptional regulator [Anaerolineales bacterium]|nr:RecX family transcriptional regulator [Anaerolineales bacterium]